MKGKEGGTKGQRSVTREKEGEKEQPETLALSQVQHSDVYHLICRATALRTKLFCEQLIRWRDGRVGLRRRVKAAVYS